jgi:hypothetical protein
VAPRILTAVVALVLALPATASADPWAGVFSLPTVCDPDPGPFAELATDDTVVPEDWQVGSPPGTLTIPLLGTDVQGFEWRVDCGAVESAASGDAVLELASGTYTFSHRAQEAGTGDWTPWVDDTISIDADPPVDLTMTPDGWQDEPVTVEVTGDDEHSGVDHVEWELDGVPGSGVNGIEVYIATHGTHTLRTRIVDAAGNASDWEEHTVLLDVNGPVNTTVVPPGWVTAPSVVVDVTGVDTGGSGVVKIEWIVDDTIAGQVGGAGPVPVVISGDGVHKLQTRLTDALNEDSGWRTQWVRIDTVAPTDTTTAATGWLPQPSLNVTVGGTDAHSGIQRVEWRVDGGPTQTYAAAARTITISGTGEHTLETRVVDVAGHSSPWVSRTIRLDATAPTNLTPTVASTGWRTTPYSVVLNGSDENSGVESVRWRVDNGPEVVGTPGLEVATVAGNGTHVLETRVRDVAGNFSSWRAEQVNIDAVKPTDTTVYPTSPVGNGRKVLITGSDAHSGLSGRVEWRLDGGEVRTTAQAVIVGPGAHTLETRVEDNAGNWSDWRSGTVTVNPALPSEDADAPIDTTVVPSNWRTSDYTVTVTADDQGGTGVDYVEWRFDGQPTQSGPSGSTFVVSSDGIYEIETRATDIAGNTSAWRSQTLRLDKTVPVDTSQFPEGWADTRTFTLDATDATSGIDRIDYRINGGATQQIAPGTNVTLPADGTFTISYRIFDVAGHATSFKHITYKVDTFAPSLTSAAAPADWQTSPISLELTGTDALSGVAGFEWQVDDGELQSRSPALIETEGVQTLKTRVLDQAGNASGWRSETVRVDLTKPVNTTPAPKAAWQKTAYTVTVSGTDAISGVGARQYVVDGGPVVTGSSVTISAEGKHALKTRLLDVAGNASDWRTDTIGIDKTAPTLTVDCGQEAWRAEAVACTVKASGGPSGLATLTVARNGGTPAPISGGAFTVEEDGAWSLEVRAVDGAGNETVKTAQAFIDRTAPTATVSCTPNPGGSGYACTGAGANAASGVAALSYSVDGGAPVTLAGDGAFTVTKGTVVVYAADGAGNVGASEPLTLADRAKPKSTASRTGTVTPRTASEAITLRGRGAKRARLVGQLDVARTGKKTTVDLRPLALGKGTYRFVITISAGRKSKRVTRTQRLTSGYSKRIKVSRAIAAKPTKVTLTVSRKAGNRWVALATSTAALK